MPAHDRRWHSPGGGSRASDGGGVGVCDGQAGADAGVEEVIVTRHSVAAPPGRRFAALADRLRAEPGISRFRGQRSASPRNDGVDHVVNTPTIAPIRQVVSVPDTIDFSPSELISSRRCGAMVPRPPIMMPRLPKLAKPHIA